MNVMKKKLFVAFTFVAVLSVEGWNLYQEKQNEPSLSEIAAENVDALATRDTCRWKDPGEYADCSSGKSLACPCGG